MNYNLNIELVSVVASLPKSYKLNSKEGFLLFGSDIKKIVRLTGIDKKHIANDEVSTLDLAISSATHLIESNKIDRNNIKLLIYVSFTFENRLPGDANKLSHYLGLDKSVLALDISSACSGYLNGLFVASSLLNSIDSDSYALIIDGDVQSKFVSEKDRSTYPVFGDACTATLVKKSDFKTSIEFLSMGQGHDQLFIKGFSSKKKPDSNDLEQVKINDNNSINNFEIYMNGISVYNFVINNVAELINNYILKFKPAIDYFVPHQANDLITKNLAKNLNLSDKLLISSNEFGNVGSASIPLTIARHVPTNSNEHISLLVSGFGAGLAANCGIIILSKNFTSSIIYLGEKNEKSDI